MLSHRRCGEHRGRVPGGGLQRLEENPCLEGLRIAFHRGQTFRGDLSPVRPVTGSSSWGCSWKYTGIKTQARVTTIRSTISWVPPRPRVWLAWDHTLGPAPLLGQGHVGRVPTSQGHEQPGGWGWRVALEAVPRRRGGRCLGVRAAHTEWISQQRGGSWHSEKQHGVKINSNPDFCCVSQFPELPEPQFPLASNGG